MNVTAIVDQVAKVKEDLEKLDGLIADYKQCKSEISLKLLGSMIEKLALNIGFKQAQ